MRVNVLSDLSSHEHWERTGWKWACYFIIFAGRHGSGRAFMGTRLSVIFSLASPKNRLKSDRSAKATGGCWSASAPSDINRSIRNTHTCTPTPTHTHLTPFPVKHMCSIAHTSASQGQRQGCCFLICSVLTHHLQSVNSLYPNVCVWVCQPLFSCLICTINKGRVREHKHLPCHQPQENISGKKEKENKKLHVFTKAGARIAVWNSTEPSSHYCFLFLRTEATTFPLSLPYVFGYNMHRRCAKDDVPARSRQPAWYSKQRVILSSCSSHTEQVAGEIGCSCTDKLSALSSWETEWNKRGLG